jgi:hypothetical protein
MNRYVLRVDDVGRLPTDDNPELGTDMELDYFFRWIGECGLIDLPAVYGAVPKWLSGAGLRRFKTLPLNCRAIHGWNHVKDATVSPDQMRESLRRLRARIYIPPFNAYMDETVSDWSVVGGTHFLGGFHGEHHNYGLEPCDVHHVVHLPAHPLLYGRAHEILDNLSLVEESDYLKVITLHVPWEPNTDTVRKLIEVIAPQLTDLGV